jgi:hypothetical protein
MRTGDQGLPEPRRRTARNGRQGWIMHSRLQRILIPRLQ